jgi:hypothetical protein
MGAGILVTLLVLIPFSRILQRAGFSPLVSLLAFFPFLGWLAIAVILARTDWPALNENARGKEA